MFHGLQPTGPAVSRGTVRIYNPTNHELETLITTVLPLPKGSYRGEAETWRAVGAAPTPQHVTFAKLGAGWRDGTNLKVDVPGSAGPAEVTIAGANGESWRYARVHFIAQIAPRTEKVVSIEVGQAQVPDFTLHADVLAALQVGYPWVKLRAGANEVDLFDQPGQVVEESPLVRVLRFRGRVPGTPFFAQLEVQFATGMRHARYWLHYGNSLIDSPTWTDPKYFLPGDVSLLVRAARIAVRHPSVKLASKVVDGIDTTAVLIQQAEAEGRFSNGCSQRLTGVLLFGPDPAPTDLSLDATTWRAMATDATPADLGVAETWRAVKAFGPFGFVPSRPTWSPDDSTFRAAAVVRAARDYADARFSNAGPWARCQYGCNPNPGDAGAQGDFGITRHTGVAMSGHPAGLHPAQRSAYQEANRPNHHRFADGNPWTLAQRPTFFWQGRPHRKSLDQFGLSGELASWDTPYARNERGQGWWSHPREHYSFLNLTCYALLTGDRGALEECDYRVELFMAEMTYPGSLGSAGSEVSNFDSARAVGRTFQSGCWLALVTGRADLWHHLDARFDAIEATKWAGATWPDPPNEFMGFVVRSPDLVNHLNVDQFYAWEEMHAVGLGCSSLHALTGNARARAIGRRVAKCMVHEAMLDTRTNWQRLRISSAGWVGGTPQPGEFVSQGAASGQLVYFHLTGSLSEVLLRNCTGQFTAGTLTAGSGATIAAVARLSGIVPATDVGRNLFRYHTPDQFYELEPGHGWPPTGPGSDSPLRHFAWGGIAASWSFPCVLIARKWAAEDGDTQAEAEAQNVLDDWLTYRTAPGDGFLDEGQAGWTEWAGVIEDPWA